MIKPIEIIWEVEIADNGAIIRQPQHDGSIIVEVAEQNGDNENRVETKLGKLLYTELLNEITSSNKHKVIIKLEAL
ncbi:MAG: hypothetical protein IKM47_06465 [Bacteroidaceae bacterium]|nr:hypothetical protein [Bacteroidaceae bacterium]